MSAATTRPGRATNVATGDAAPEAADSRAPATSAAVGPATKAGAVLALESEIVTLLRRVRRTSAERARSIHPELTALGYHALMHVRDNEGCTQSDVVESLAMDKGAVSRQVQQLVDLGLVDRVEHPADRRARRLTVSVEGRRRLGALERERRSAYLARFDDWSTAELQELVDTLARYNLTLDRA